MTFSVTANGTYPLIYQWFFNTDTISGAVGNTYTINSISTSDGGDYSCKISNSCSPIASTNNIILTVNQAPSITSQSSGDTWGNHYGGISHVEDSPEAQCRCDHRRVFKL